MTKPRPLPLSLPPTSSSSSPPVRDPSGGVPGRQSLNPLAICLLSKRSPPFPTTPWLQKALGLPGSSCSLRATTKVRKGTEEGARSGSRAAAQGGAPSRPSPRSPFSLRPLKPRRAEWGGAGSLGKGWTGCPFRTPSPRHFPESPLLARPQPLPVPFRTQSTETRGPLPCRTFQ